MTVPTNGVRDGSGIRRKPALFQATSPLLDRLRTMLGAGRYWIEPTEFAKLKDRDILTKVLRDPVIYAKVQQRLHIAAAAEWYFEPADRYSRPLVPYFTAIFQRIPNFAQSRRAVCLAILEGIGFLRMSGKTASFCINGKPETQKTWWYPGYLSHISADGIRREVRYEKVAMEDGSVWEKPEYYWTTFDAPSGQFLEVPREMEDWYVKFIYHDDHSTYGFGRSMLDALYIYAHAKTQIFRDMVQGAGKFGRPWLHVRIPAGELAADDDLGSGMLTNEELAASLVTQMKKMEGGNLLVTDSRVQITPLDFNGEAARGLIEILNYLDKIITEAILGASMPTGGGEEGSYARAAVERMTTSDLLRFDRIALEESLQTLVGAVWKYNTKNFAGLMAPDGSFLSSMIPPTLRLRDHGEKPDPANVQLALSLGLPVDREEAYKAFGLRQPDADDDVIQPPGAGGAVPGLDGPAVDLHGNPTRGANETVEGDGVEGMG